MPHKTTIVPLPVAERAMIDCGPLNRLVHARGAAAADHYMSEGIEGLFDTLIALQRAIDRAQYLRATRLVGVVIRQAQHLGLSSVANVGAHLSTLLGQQDPAAQAAVLARLHRLSTQSARQIWQIEDRGA